jgi:dephospho-CoA kinase
LEEAGYSYHRFSQILERILRERGETVSRDALQRVGRQIHQSPGQRWLCEQLASAIPKEGNVVVDGMRYVEDHAYLAKKFGPAFLHIHIDAPTELRYARGISRGDSEAALRGAFSEDARLTDLRSLAHAVVHNTGDVEALNLEVHRAIALASGAGP